MLHPIDLYHAIRTTKSFRRFLLSRDSASIWKESFLNHQDIPFYPDDVSPPKWVSLMFGPATCDVCGTDNTLVDYGFRWRKCDDCADYFKEALYGYEEYYSFDSVLMDEIMESIRQSRFAVRAIDEAFPDQVDVIWQLVARTCLGDPFYYSGGACDIQVTFSISQVEEVASTMKKYLTDIQTGELNAESNYEKFVNATKAEIEKRTAHAHQCDRWANSIQERSQNEFGESVPAFIAECKEALLRRGYDPKDVNADWLLVERNSVRDTWFFMSDIKLNKSKIWKYLPLLESQVLSAREMRLEREHRKRQKVRRKKLDAIFCDVECANFIAEVHQYVPSGGIHHFANWINDPQELVVDPPSDSARQILEYMQKNLLANSKLQSFSKILFDCLQKACLFPDGTDFESNPCHFLNLAVAVFECCGSVFSGWEEIGVHRCKNGVNFLEGDFSSSLVRFSEVGHQTLKILAELLHINSLESVSTKDLDALNRRFVCKTCPIGQKNNVCLRSMTWRECLCHAVKVQNYPQGSQHDAAAQFDILSDTLMKTILAEEWPFPSNDESDWCCRHGHVFNPSKSGDPRLKWDKYHKRCSLVKRRPFVVDLNPGIYWQCVQCPELDVLWKATDGYTIWGHLLLEHGVKHQNVVEGVDCIEVQAVEDYSWIREKMTA
ncbi:hypothetical protein BDN70DRAFT_870338 [Pholiota conissans]|uniref:F-box domain-containing protein n=1 Tax=Pholiota conissans TaxID=109636 RepID=A0A9P5ZFP3_9AGAR|nr:hypothetical protein BDN70DRAFT_870338 [Pholiota conissans]